MYGIVWKQFKIQNNIFKLDAVPCRYCLTLTLINIRKMFYSTPQLLAVPAVYVFRTCPLVFHFSVGNL